MESSGNGSSLSAAKGSVTVKATDTTDLNLNTGNANVGGAAAVGAAIEVAVYRNTVTAMIGNYNTVTAKSILVQAIADRDIQAAAVMASASGPQVSTEVSLYFPSEQELLILMQTRQKPMEAAIPLTRQVRKHLSVARRQ